jgi:hypothetical protein
MKKIYFVFLIMLGGQLFAQSSSTKSTFKIYKNGIFDPQDVIPNDFQTQLIHLEMPSPDGESYRSFLMQQKIRSKNYFDTLIREKTNTSRNRSAAQPIVADQGFIPTRKLSTGTILSLTAGIPSDNTCAISNDGIALIGINSHIYANNTITNEPVFEDHNIPLSKVIFPDLPPFGNYFDPKIVYDPDFDRFVLTFLRGNTPTTSQVIMCFSSSNNPADPWYVYILSGNPLDNNRWTDFPCLSLTNDKVYYTANLIIPNVSWQVGFDGSIIWEMDKAAAFAGADDIDATLYYDIKFEDKFVRNLHPVNGSEGVADELILLSNRNFDITNDTIFVVKIADGMPIVDAVVADLAYGVPPNGRQSDTDTSDPTMGLQTNDARVLAAVKLDDELHFVGNTIDPETGFSAIYYGILTWTDGYEIRGQIIGDAERDFAYPNIAWVGNEACDREFIINFLYTSPTIFPGSAAVYVDNDGEISEPITILEGDEITDRLPGGYERWGDYTGLQRKYNADGSTFSFTYHTLNTKINTGFGVQIFSPDSSRLSLNLMLQGAPVVCGNVLSAVINGGIAPYSIFWNDSEVAGSITYENFCIGDTVSCRVIDARGCEEKQIFVPSFNGNLDQDIVVFPNPSENYAAVVFNVIGTPLLRAKLFDSAGNLVAILLEEEAKDGLNQLVFSVETLAQGVYHLAIFADNEKIYQEKILKK